MSEYPRQEETANWEENGTYFTSFADGSILAIDVDGNATVVKGKSI